VNVDLTRLPDDVGILKEIIHSQAATYQEIRRNHLELQNSHITLEQRYGVVERDLTNLRSQYNLLEEQLRLLKDKIYGRKSEKYVADDTTPQISLFNEPEEVVETEASQEKTEEVSVASYKRAKGGRRPLPPELPRVEVIQDLAESEKICECGTQLSRISDEVSEKLDIIPAKMQVIKNIRYKYACKGCDGVESEGGAVKIAPLPPQLIPQGIATPGLLAHIMTAKYADALPLYRQEKIFERIGVELSRATMANWVIQVGQRCEPLMDSLRQEICSGPVINMDETPVQVLNEPGRPNTSKSYMWVFRGGDVKRPALVFHYDPSRSGDVPQKYLDGYQGYIQTDGYQGYNVVGERAGIVHLGCWVHVRRKFKDVIKAKAKGDKKKGYADEAIEYIQQIYAVESEADVKELTAVERYQLRQKKAVPLLKEIRKWLEDISPKAPPQSLLGKAVSYTLNQWERLEKYTLDGLLRPDNNLAENAIRPFVVGRKNWLFAGHPRGAGASATIYSLIETAKANDLEPYRYLRYLFERLPMAETEADYKALLPQYVDRDLITNMKF